MDPAFWEPETSIFFKTGCISVYLCGRITAPHTGLACTLHCFESVSVISCVRRYFLRQRRVYGKTRKKLWLRVDVALISSNIINLIAQILFEL